MTNTKRSDIILLIADMDVVTASDVSLEFGIPLDTAVKRLVYLSEKGYLIRTVNEETGNSEYRVKTMNVDIKTSAKAHLTKVINWMKRVNHPDLKLVPESRGGTNTGGGYLYQWERLLMIIQQMETIE